MSKNYSCRKLKYAAMLEDKSVIWDVLILLKKLIMFFFPLSLAIFGLKIAKNTSLVASGALAHRLQRRTAC